MFREVKALARGHIALKPQRLASRLSSPSSGAAPLTSIVSRLVA